LVRIVGIVRIVVIIWILAGPAYASLSLLALIRIIASLFAIACIVCAGIVVITADCSSFTGSTRTSIACGASVAIVTEGVIVRMDTLACSWIAVVGARIVVAKTFGHLNAFIAVKGSYVTIIRSTAI
jgi:hypothetical protein